MTGPMRPGSGMDLSSDDLSLLDQLLGDAGVSTAQENGPIRRRPAGAPVPLSFAQELLWLLERASPGMTAYKLPFARRIRGPLDRTALEKSLTALVTRHEPLRTRFEATVIEPVQVIDPPAPVRLDIIDVRGSENPLREAERIVGELARKPFDLATEHLFRPTLLQLGDSDHVLLLDTHHMVADGWSRDIMFRELAACYAAFRAGREPALPELPIQFADYAVWQREHLAGERLAQLLGFWRRQLGDATEPLDLPTDYSRAAAPKFGGARAQLLVPLVLLTQVKELGRRHDATLYMVLLAAYMTVLHRYSSSARILVGSGSAGRTRAETEGLIGYLNNTLVQRGDFGGDPTYGALLAQVRDSALGAYDHQEVPLEKLVLELREGQQQLSDAPLFQAVLTMQDGLESRVDFVGLELQSFGVDTAATKFDLTLLPAERPEGLWLTLQYRSDLYERASAERFLGHVQRILEGAVADSAQPVSRLPLLTDAEVAQLRTWNATTVDFGPLQCVHRRFEAGAIRTPHATALICDPERLSYSDVDRRANQLAHRLRAMDVAVGTPVGIALGRSADAIVALLAVLKAGGCYVPLATDSPAARLAQQLADSGASIVVTHSSLVGRLPAGARTLCMDAEGSALTAESGNRPAVEVGGDDVAYILFTSGSTGVPKGVAVTHANIANYTSAIGRVFGLDDLSPLQFATVSTLVADLGNTAIFPALTTGGTLHVLASDVALDGPRFATYMKANPVDVLKITPSHLRALMNAAGPANLLPQRWLVVGGEACPWELVEEVRRVGTCKILNHYGPTEATVGASVFPVAARYDAPLAATVPIGFPLANVQLHVLDAVLEAAPVGIPGELYIGGAGVTSGYVNRPDLTAERFIASESLGRLYRTGDRVRRLPDGAVEFLGRTDGQVKIRGFRVELGEIEQVLGQFPGVDRCVVVMYGSTDGAGDPAAEPALAAYVVPKASGYSAAHGARPTPDRLRDWAT